METIELIPGGIVGRTHLPPSKSHTLRAILFASLAEGISHVHNILDSPDTEAMITACRHIGADIVQSGSSLTIRGGIKQGIQKLEIDAGNSGIVLRFMTAVGAVSGAETIVTGDTSCRVRRPSLPLLEGLKQMGASVSFPPIWVKGPLHPAHVRVDGADSQPVSALLIAAALLEGTTEIEVVNLGERPWLMVTLDWLQRVGVSFEVLDNRFFIHGRANFKPFSYRVPSDLSSLAFLFTLAMLSDSELTIEDVDLDDIQGDKVLLDIYKRMGADFVIENKNLYIKGPQKLSGCAIDVNDCIDCLPILAVAACFSSQSVHLYNGKIARKKESDRIASMARELTKMGAKVEEQDDGLTIHQSSLSGAELFSHEDHRVAMSLAVAAMLAEGKSRLSGIECVKKTYKDFFLEIQRLRESYVKTTSCGL